MGRATGKKGVKGNIKDKNLDYGRLVIDHLEPEIKIIKYGGFMNPVTSEVILYTDGRGDVNADDDGGRVGSTTKWEGKGLVTTVFRRSESGKKSSTIILRITLELSKDGNSLTLRKSPVDPRGGPQSMAGIEFQFKASKVVYQRTQD